MARDRDAQHWLGCRCAEDGDGAFGFAVRVFVEVVHVVGKPTGLERLDFDSEVERVCLVSMSRRTMNE